MRVAIASSRQDRIEAAAEALRQEGAEALPLTLDVADCDAWPRGLAEVEGLWGPVDLLCLNAGVSAEIQRIEDTPPALWRRLVDVNLNAVYYAVRAWLPQARERDWAHLMITGSLTGLMPMAGSSGYGSAKAGLWMLADTLRMELAGSSVGISVMHPGVTRTDILETNRYHSGPDAPPVNARVAEFVSKGADPAKVAAFTVAAIKRGEYHIGTHAEHRDGIAQRFDELLDAMGESADTERDLSQRPKPSQS